MAKDDAFKVPPFDEKVYIEKELFEGKRTMFMIAYCTSAAVLSAAIWLASAKDPRPGILFGAIGVLGIRPFLVYVGKLDIKKMKPKDWAVTVLFYVFGWLWLWLLLMEIMK